MTIGASRQNSAFLGPPASGDIAPRTLPPKAPPRLSRREQPYAHYQAAYHRAFCNELRQMLADVFGNGARFVLDVACGDGTYAAWLMEQGAQAAVAVDTNLPSLRRANRPVHRRPSQTRVLSVAADASRLPFDDDSFDAVWCAQSLISLPDARTAIAEMRRVTRPGGITAVLENDALHEVILPWSPELELKVRRAELSAFRSEMAEPRKCYIGRFLPAAFRAASFESCSLKTYAFTRSGPPNAEVRSFLDGYFAQLRERIKPYVSERDLALFDGFSSPAAASCVLTSANFALTCLNHVAFAEK